MRKEYYFWIKVNATSITGKYWKYKNKHLGLPRLIPNQVWYMTYPSFAFTCREGVQPRTVCVAILLFYTTHSSLWHSFRGKKRWAHPGTSTILFHFLPRGSCQDQLCRLHSSPSAAHHLTSLGKNSALSGKHSWAQGSTGVSVQATDTGNRESWS